MSLCGFAAQAHAILLAAASPVLCTGDAAASKMARERHARERLIAPVRTTPAARLAGLLSWWRGLWRRQDALPVQDEAMQDDMVQYNMLQDKIVQDNVVQKYREAAQKRLQEDEIRKRARQ